MQQMNGPALLGHEVTRHSPGGSGIPSSLSAPELGISGVSACFSVPTATRASRPQCPIAPTSPSPTSISHNRYARCSRSTSSSTRLTMDSTVAGTGSQVSTLRFWTGWFDGHCLQLKVSLLISRRSHSGLDLTIRQPLWRKLPVGSWGPSLASFVQWRLSIRSPEHLKFGMMPKLSSPDCHPRA